MTAEQFHDALSLLPMELVEEVDRRRQFPKKKPIPWGKYAGLAACLALLLGCSWVVNGIFHAGSKATESALQEGWDTGAIAADEAAPAEAAPAAGKPGLTFLAVAAAPVLTDSSINYQSPPQVQVISRVEDLPVAVDLPEGWFDSHDLVAIFLTGYAEVPQPLEILRDGDSWEILFPAAEREDTAKDWYVLLEAPKDQISPEQVHLTFAER